MGLKLRDHGCNVTVDSEGRVRGVFTKLVGGNVDLDEFGGWIPFGRGTKMKNPVETRTKKEDNISFTKGSTTGTGSVQWVRVWDDTFAHGGGKKRDLGLGDKGADRL